MIQFMKKNFESPDDRLDYPGARMQLVRVGGMDVWRVVADPGWRYSESAGPAEGTERCQARHVLWLVVSGQLAVQMEDGSVLEFGPGDVGSIPPGHDSWVVGDETLVALDVLPAATAATAEG